MPTVDVHQCGCSYCKQDSLSECNEQHRLMNLLLSVLEPQQRRLYAATEAKRLGAEGSKIVSQITGISRETIHRGLKELEELSLTGTINRVIKPSEHPVGPPRVETKYPNIHEVLEQILDFETAGNPMKEQKWVRSSLTNLVQQLKDFNINVGRCTVWRILKDMGFSMRISIKTRKGFGSDSPDRDVQFKYIALMRQEFSGDGKPIISVDTKKGFHFQSLRRIRATYIR